MGEVIFTVTSISFLVLLFQSSWAGVTSRRLLLNYYYCFLFLIMSLFYSRIYILYLQLWRKNYFHFISWNIKRGLRESRMFLVARTFRHWSAHAQTQQVPVTYVIKMGGTSAPFTAVSGHPPPIYRVYKVEGAAMLVTKSPKVVEQKNLLKK